MIFTDRNHPFKHAFKHKGGAGASGGAAQQTVQSTPPPPTAQSVEIQMEQRDANKAAQKRKGYNKTILAGETGAQSPLGLINGSGTTGETVRRTTLLGGG